MRNGEDQIKKLKIVSVDGVYSDEITIIYSNAYFE